MTRVALTERIEAIRAEIAAVGRDGVRIIAVTKGFPPATIVSARGAGLEEFGESYAQDLLDKVDVLDGSTVHFIGRIQRNKVRKIANVVDLWHSVDRVEVLDEIGRRTPGAEVLIQVNPVADPTKSGVGEMGLADMLAHASSAGVTVRGLMTIGVQDDREATRAAFAAVDRLADEHGLAERSMGMSADYLDAVAAGSTMIRLGTTLFGLRT